MVRPSEGPGEREPGPIRLLVLDDHAVVRAGVRASVADDGDGVEVVTETDSVQIALEVVEEDRVDVTVVDVCLPGGNGIDFVREARRRNERVAHVMFTSYREEETLFQAAMAGASAFLIKDVEREDVARVVRQVATGEKLICPELIDGMARSQPGNGLPDDQVLGQLTDRERTIVDLMAFGCTNGEIADELCLAEKTIRNYVSNILAKLNMRNRTEVAAYVAKSVARRDGALLRAAM